MKIRVIIAVIVVILLLLAVVFLTAEKAMTPVLENQQIIDDQPEDNLGDQNSTRYKVLNSTYIFLEEEMKLDNGLYVTNAPAGTEGYQRFSIFGEPIYKDLDNDNDEDAALLLVRETSGTGIFYYATAAVNDNGGFAGTNLVFIGDRISPQNLEFNRGILTVNYATRELDEPMTTPPSIGKSMFLKLENGKLLETNAKDDLIRVDLPLPGSVITSPLTFSGQARGTWFFEASFPVTLVNWDGLIIGQGIATADGEWMTEDYVPFSGSLEFTVPDYGDNGALIFRKDNPSGLPEHDNALEMQIFFK